MQDLSVIRSPQDICFQELPHRSKARMYSVYTHVMHNFDLSLWPCTACGQPLGGLWWPLYRPTRLCIQESDFIVCPHNRKHGAYNLLIAHIIIIKQPASRRALREVNRCCAAQFVHTSWPNSRQKAKLYPANNQTTNLQKTKQPSCKQPNNQTANNQNQNLQTTKQPDLQTTNSKPPTYCSYQWFGKMPRMHFRFYIAIDVHNSRLAWIDDLRRLR